MVSGARLTPPLAPACTPPSAPSAQRPSTVADRIHAMWQGRPIPVDFEASKSLLERNLCPLPRQFHLIAFDGPGPPCLPVPAAFVAHALRCRHQARHLVPSQSQLGFRGNALPQSVSHLHSSALLLKQLPSRPRRIAGALGVVLRTRSRL